METSASEPISSAAREQFESPPAGSSRSGSISSDSVGQRERRASRNTYSPPAEIHTILSPQPTSMPRHMNPAPALSLFDIVDADPYGDDR